MERTESHSNTDDLGRRLPHSPPSPGYNSGMPRFSLTADLEADCQISGETRIGQAYYVVRNASGGSNSTPIARYFVWRPTYTEGFHEFWEVDCFVRDHPLAPERMLLGRALVAALIREGLCAEPIWLTAYTRDDGEGQAFGQVFDDD